MQYQETSAFTLATYPVQDLTSGLTRIVRAMLYFQYFGLQSVISFI